MSKEIGRFTIGGVNGSPSFPPPWLQTALGTKIKIDITSHILFVPTEYGIIPAIPGDTIVYYDNNRFEVERK